jgi:hypothetical protein
MKCTIIPVIIGATGRVTKGLKKNLKAITGKHSTENYKRPLYLEQHTSYRKYCNLKFEVWVVGITAGSRGEVPGRKSP